MQTEKNINHVNTNELIMKTKQKIYLSLSLLLLLTSPGQGKPLSSAADSLQNTDPSCIFISDTQRPMWFEKLFVKTHRNESAAEILLNSISSDRSVSTVFLLGDITSMASINGNWKKMDDFLAEIRSRHVSAFAAAGNHDYLLSAVDGETNFKKRFPEFNRTGYTVRRGPFALIILNSNFSKLDHDEKVAQQEWYIKELKALDNDPSIDIVAVGCHHPPYSNSTIVGHSRKVREEFVPPFNNSKKTRFFISGHAHTFQHFTDSTVNKHFFVIGGGGGLLHKLKKRKDDVLTDRTGWDYGYRMFHYMKGRRNNGEFILTVMMLDENLQGPKPVYEISIPVGSHDIGILKKK
jgi:hypothetical protein